VNNSVFSNFLNSARDDEERTASGKLFQTEAAVVEKALLCVSIQTECGIGVYSLVVYLRKLLTGVTKGSRTTMSGGKRGKHDERREGR